MKTNPTNPYSHIVLFLVCAGSFYACVTLASTFLLGLPLQMYFIQDWSFARYVKVYPRYSQCKTRLWWCICPYRYRHKSGLSTFIVRLSNHEWNIFPFYALIYMYTSRTSTNHKVSNLFWNRTFWYQWSCYRRILKKHEEIIYDERTEAKILLLYFLHQCLIVINWIKKIFFFLDNL